MKAIEPGVTFQGGAGQGGKQALVDRATINESWLIALRWAAVVGQLITIFVVRYLLGLKIPLVVLTGIAAATAVTNLLFVMARSRGLDESPESRGRRAMLLGSIMAFDLLVLTLLFWFSGGPFNPFTIFYVVNVALAAVLLSPRWSWFVFALAICCYSALFLFYGPWTMSGGTEPLANGGRGSVIVTIPHRLYLLGNFVATMIAATTTVYFIVRLTTQIAGLDQELEEARRRKERAEKLEGLATLAAGAAHELATPLSTIAVVVKELERSFKTVQVPSRVREDFELIRNELTHCRSILDHMSANAGETMGEPLRPTAPIQLIREALGLLRTPERVRLDLGGLEHSSCMIAVPPQTCAHVLRGLLQNAMDASPAEKMVVLVAREEPGALRLEVHDHGQGMSGDLLQRVGEPFLTTKEPGRGMGLGLFLARSVLERVGGALDLRSVTGHGTTAAMRIPLAAANGENGGRFHEGS